MIIDFDPITWDDSYTLYEIRIKDGQSILVKSTDLEMAREVPHKFMIEKPDPERPHVDLDPLVNGVPLRQWGLLSEAKRHEIRMRYWRA